jgi:carbon-monoxide dehydrogenase large subunit
MPEAAYIGSAIPRREDPRFLTGRGTFVDDIHLDGLCHATIVRSPLAHARIVEIDASAALAMPGVLAVLTFRDFADKAKPIPIRLAPIPRFDEFLQMPLASDKVRFVGEPVAVVIADSQYLAEDAMSRVEVDYDPLPAIVSPQQGLADDILIHDHTGTNVAARYSVANGKPDGVFDRAPYTRRETFRCQRHGAVPMETRGFVADYDTETRRLTVWGGTKVNFHNRRILADLLDFPEAHIEMVDLDVGGGFGSRGEFYPEDFLIPFAAIRVGRPVKWIEDRREHLTAANQSRDIECELEIACEKDGTLLGMRARIRADMGAYLRTNGGVVPCKAMQAIPGPYRVPAFAGEVEAVVTNKTPTGTYRAPGRFESTFFRERLFDLAAADLGMDPVAFRMKNLLADADMPYPIGELVPYEGPVSYDIADLRPLLERAIAEAEDTSATPDAADGRLHGFGVTCSVDATGLGPSETARIVLREDGHADVYLGLSAMGQGHQTIFAQICADMLEIDMDSVTVHRTGTANIADGFGTYASRGTVMAGNALAVTAEEVKRQLVQAAGMRLNLAEDELEYRDGAVHRRDDDEAAMDLPAILQARQALGLGTLDVTERYQQTGGTFTHAAHAARVAVDPDTGGIEILSYVTVEDVGRCVNPMTVHGQAVGGAVQGIGGALLEEFTYGDDGQPLSATFADYLLPTATDVPEVRSVALEETPSTVNPLGFKGAGEGSILASGAVLANAVADALSGYGVEVTKLPLSPTNVRRMIAEAEKNGRKGL